MPDTDKQYPTPAELADYLEGKKKARGQLARGREARCCIGHYADMCGLIYDPEGARIAVGPPPAHLGSIPRLPADHWLFTDTSEGPLQDRLIVANDGSAGFTEVQSILRSIEA